MFSAFSTGLSGLVKVAQDKIIVASAEEPAADVQDEKKTAETKLPVDADASKVVANKPEAADVTTEVKSGENEAPSSSSTTTTAAADAPADGDNILGAAKEWGNFLFGGVKDVTMKGTPRCYNILYFYMVTISGE